MNKKAFCTFLVLTLLIGIVTSVFFETLKMGQADDQSSDSNGNPDSWAMFRSDLSHSGYSNSTGPNTNNIDWNYQTGSGVLSSPAVVSGVVYVGSENGVVYALDASLGLKLWSYQTGGEIISSPAVANGVVYIGSWDKSVYALNATTGEKLWSYQTGSYVESSPAVAGGVVYIASYDANVYALNASTGQILWIFATGSGAVGSSPAVSGSEVFVGDNGGNIYALNVVTGNKLWSQKVGDTIYSSPAVFGGIVYVGADNSNTGDVCALNATTGSLLWVYQTGNFWVYSSPAVFGGAVYVGSFDHVQSGGSFYALNASSGGLLWSYATGGEVWGSPAVANGVVYVGGDDDNVYAFNTFTGSVLWSYQTSGSVAWSSPAIAGGMVYVGSEDSNVYAFGPNSHHSFTYVNGTISQDTTWMQADSPYVLTGNVFVPNNITLNIQPGVTVNLTSYFISVNGTLRALGGDNNNQIVFKGGDITFTPTSNGWNQSTGTGNIIANAVLNSYLVDNSSARISRDNITMGIQANAATIIENSTITGGISAFGDPTISNNVISGQGLTLYQNATVQGNLIVNNNAYGVEIFAWEIPSATSPLIENNTITQNGDGIYLPSESGQPSPIIWLNNIYGNNYNVFSAVQSVNAAENYWGTTSQSAIAATISGNVTFIPLFTQPNPWAPSYNPNPNPTPTPTPLPSPTTTPGPYATVNVLTSTGGITDPSAGTYSFANLTTVTLTATPSSGYSFQNWYIVSSFAGNYSYTDNPHSLSVAGGASYSVQALFVPTSTPPPSAFNILSMAFGHGSISPNGTVSVANGGSQTYTITANDGYQIANVIVNGSSVGAVSTYTFTNVQANYEIEAIFTIAPTPTPTPIPSPTPSPTPIPLPRNATALEISCVGSTSYSNFNVEITGSLTAGAPGVPNAEVLLSYSVNDGKSWIDLTTVYTDGSGLFSASWIPQASGYYLMQGVYEGNSIYSNTSKIVNFALATLQAQTFFSVTSNSTLTSLFFNSTSDELSFGTFGLSGTTGYVSISIPKSLVSQVSSLKVYLDGSPVPYSSTLQEDSWLISFTYHQSSHEVTVSLGTVTAQTPGTNQLVIAGVIVAIIIVIVVALIVWKTKRKKHA